MIKTEMVELARDGGRSFQAHLALPAPGTAPPGGRPAVMILNEMFGLNDPMRGFARHYAERGHPVMVPDMFWRCDPAGGLSYSEADFVTAWARLKVFDYDSSAIDMRTTAEALRRQPGCNGTVVAIGFCMGGRLAYLAAARSGVEAAIGFYALGITNHLAEVDAIRGILHLHYGDKDTHVPLSEIEAVERAVAGRPNIVVYRYPEAGHSFFNQVRPTYDPAAAALAATRVDTLLAAL